MKKLFLLLAIMFIGGMSLLAQAPPVPPTNPSGGGGGGPVGAPIDGGLGILLAMGAAYGGRKIYQFRKKKETEA